MMSGEDSAEIRQDLATSANPSCPLCQGKGIEHVEDDNLPMFNVSNEMAKVLLALFHLEGMDGSMSLAEARRGIMRARSKSDISEYVVPEDRVYGKPVVREDGTVELRPLRMLSFGVSSDRILDRLQAFINFVEESAHLGATTISWS